MMKSAEKNHMFLKLDNEYNIVNDAALKGNLLDYVLPIFNNLFITKMSNLENEDSFFIALSVSDNVIAFQLAVNRDDKYFYCIFQSYQILSSISNENILGFLSLDYIEYYINSCFLFGKHFLLNESIDYFTYENDLNILVNPEHVSIYTNHLRNIAHRNICHIQMYINGEQKWIRFMTLPSSIEGELFVALIDATMFFNTQISVVRRTLRDPLTNTLQKESIIQYISDYIKNNKDNTGSLFYLDIDYFKNINETYGHSFGDMIISRACDVIKRFLRKFPGGLIGRVSGDKFVIFIPNIVEFTDVKDIGSKLRIELMKIVVPEIKSFVLSATMGITRYPLDGNNYDILLKKAEKALERGKEKGRDCYVIYNESLHGTLSDKSNKVNLEEIAQKVSKDTGMEYLCKAASILLLEDDIKEKVKKAFTLIAESLSLERIVFHYRANDELFKYAYTSKPGDLVGLRDYDIDILNKFHEFFNNEFVLNVSNTNILKYKDYELQNYFFKCKPSAFLTIMIPNDDGISGFISYEMTTKKRVWKSNEIMVFKIFKGFLEFLFEKYYKEHNKLPAF